MNTQNKPNQAIKNQAPVKTLKQESTSIKQMLKDGSYKLIDQQAKKLSNVLDVYSTAAINAVASVNTEYKDTWVTQKVTQASNKVNSYAAELGTTSAPILVSKAGQLVSNNKGIALAAGFTLGFALSRAFGATAKPRPSKVAQNTQQQSSNEQQADFESNITLEADIEANRSDLIGNNKVLERPHVELSETNPEFLNEDDVNSVTGDNAQKELYFQTAR